MRSFLFFFVHISSNFKCCLLCKRWGGGWICVCCCLHLPEKVCVPSSLKSAESYWRGALRKMVCQNKNGIEIDLGGINAGGRCQKAAALVTGDSGSREGVRGWHADQNRYSKLLRLVICAQSCLTLCDPVDCRPPGPSIRGVSQPRILERAAIFYARELS